MTRTVKSTRGDLAFAPSGKPPHSSSSSLSLLLLFSVHLPQLCDPPSPCPQFETLTQWASDTKASQPQAVPHPPSSAGSTVLRIARTRPRGEPKRKKSDTSKSKRPRLTAGGSASSFSILEWMLGSRGDRCGGLGKGHGSEAFAQQGSLKSGYRESSPPSLGQSP